MDRQELDAFVVHHKLPPEGGAAAFEVVRAQPDAAETRHFLLQLLRLAGILSLAAGVVFFVAANWQELRVFGRFFLIEALLLASIAVAFWKPAPAIVGRLALLLAFIVSGALLALFGQTYQTGADLYELFLAWALLGLPLVLAAQWSVSWAVWLVVLNIALALFCGTQSRGGLLRSLLDSSWDTVEVLTLQMTVNLSLWALCEYLQHTRWQSITQQWLGRLAFSFAIVVGTWAGAFEILDNHFNRGVATTAVIVLAVLALSAGSYVLRKRRDVFPVALLSGSGIVLGTCVIAANSNSEDIGSFFMLALWLIVSSAVCGRFLMKLVKDWKHVEAAA